MASSKTLAGDAIIEASTATSSAVQRVFNLPELLEMTLVHLACTSRRRRYSQRQYETELDAPVEELFVIQRVNSLFRAIISRSRTIQQRMFLAYYSAGSISPRPLERVQWLADRIGIVHCDHVLSAVTSFSERTRRVCIDMFEARSVTDSPWHDPYTGRTYRGDFINDYPEASWRKMLLNCFEDGEPLRVRWDCHCRQDVSDRINTDRMTLGELHDELQLPPTQALCQAPSLPSGLGQTPNSIYVHCPDKNLDNWPRSLLWER